jgi:hypothetical protein
LFFLFLVTLFVIFIVYTPHLSKTRENSVLCPLPFTYGLVFSGLSRYAVFMTIEQTIDVPASRRLTLDVPPEIPAGKVILTFTPAEDSPSEDETEFLLRSPTNRERLLRAVANVEQGRNLISFDTLDDAVKAAEQAKDKDSL